VSQQPKSKRLFKSSEQGPKSSLPRQGGALLVAAVLLSLLLHLASYINVSYYTSNRPGPKVDIPIKITINDKRKIPDAEDPVNKQVVEVKQEKTKKPTDPAFKSFTDHSAEKQTRLEVTKPNERAQDAGNQGQKPKQEAKVDAGAKPKTPKLKIDSAGSLAVGENKEKQEKYRALLPDTKDLSRLVDAGYQQYLDEDIAIGDRVDINTTEYRYMGYMTAMRKSIELVWNYPLAAAQRNMQGEVGLEFIIEKNGEARRVRVTKSSGYKILDDAIVEAIKLAAPFAPLPEGFGKERIVISGLFRYVLSSFLAGAH